MKCLRIQQWSAAWRRLFAAVVPTDPEKKSQAINLLLPTTLRVALISWLGLTTAPGCSSGSAMDSMMTSYCNISDNDYVPVSDDDGCANCDTQPPIDCNYTKGLPFGSVCRHAGSNWKHNWACDEWGNQLFPDTGPHTMGTVDDYGWGCDAVFNTGGGTTTMDGIIKKGGITVGFEVKADNYEGIQSNASCPDSIKKSILSKIEARVQSSVAKERIVAKACNIKYQLVVTDGTLYRMASQTWYGKDPQIDVEWCQQCRNQPAQPDDWNTKPQNVPAISPGYTRFWIDADGTLQEKHLTTDDLP